ncbi:9576_t:CDS:2, partial [Racocetra fulgida]
PGTIDCQVIYIDDKPAIDVITEFARNHISSSRDLSVRFNLALASFGFGTGDFTIGGRLFTSRNKLPKSPNISYTLNCNGKISKINREWKTFIKSSSYISPYIDGTTVGKAKLIYDAFIARFYILQDFGVVLISTEDVSDSDLKYRYISDMVFGFILLAKKGIEKIVLDLSNNYGGSVDIAHNINKILFPNIQSFPVDMKVNDISAQFIEGFSMISSLYNDLKNGYIQHYKTYISTRTNASFNSVKDFIGNNLYTRGDIQLKYTSKAFLNHTVLYGGSLELPTPPKFPWNEKDIIILTNGLCFSSCATITQRLAEINVPTVVVGGFPNKRFSFASTSGGYMVTTGYLQTYVKRLKNLNSSLVSSLTLSETLSLSFTIVEAYSVNHPNEVMDFSFRPADYQLYYDER